MSLPMRERLQLQKSVKQNLAALRGGNAAMREKLALQKQIKADMARLGGDAAAAQAANGLTLSAEAMKQLDDAGFSLKLGDPLIVTDPNGASVFNAGYDDQGEMADLLKEVEGNLGQWIADYQKDTLKAFVGRLPKGWVKFLDFSDDTTPSINVTTDFMDEFDHDLAMFMLWAKKDGIKLTHDDGTEIARVADWKQAVQRIKQEKPGEVLTTYSEAELAERERQQQTAQEAEQHEREQAERKAQADRDRDDFRLSGSTSTSDTAASYGQNDMLGAMGPPPETAAEALSQVAAETDPNPSEAQANADNYRKGRITIHGLDIAIENAKGSTRRGVDEDGSEWKSTLAHHYGDIKGTRGADGDNLDVFIGDDPAHTTLYVIDQRNPAGGFDEHKVMLGFTSEADAKAAYLANYDAGWKGLGDIRAIGLDGFKKWLKDGDMQVPFATYLEAPASTEQDNAQESPDDFPGPKGRSMEVKTAKGTVVDTRFTVLEASDLIASHTPDGRENAAFPQELQPRDRSRDSSRAWIQKVAKDLDPGLLGKTKKADSGAPIIGKDRIVESGNGRTLAIMEAYRLGTADEYKAWLIEDAASYGLNPSAIAKMTAPVLVRVRSGSLDRAAFAVEANQDDKLAMTATEKAKADANRLTPELMGRFDPGADGDMLVASNRPFIMGFLQSLGDAEAAQYLTSTGEFTGPLIARLQAAVFAKAYEDERLLELMADSAKPENRNIISALSAAAPEFIQARAANAEGTQDASEKLAESVTLSLENEAVKSLIDATNIVRQAKREGMEVDEYVSQMGLFGDIDPGVAAMAVFIAQNNRSAKRLSTAFKAMAEFVRGELERDNAAAGDIFGGNDATVSMADVVAAANRVMEREYGEGQYRIDTPAPGGLFEGVERIRARALTMYLL